MIESFNISSLKKKIKTPNQQLCVLELQKKQKTKKTQI